MSEHKYGSAQQKLESATAEIIKQLDGLKTCVNGLAEERGEIKTPIPLIGFGGMWGHNTFKDPDKLPSSLNDDFFYEATRTLSNWSNKDAIRKSRDYVETVFANATDYCQRLLVVLKERHEQNIPVLTGNNKAYEHIKAFMTSYGFYITESETELVRGKSKTISKPAGWMNSLNKTVSRTDRYDEYVSSVNTWLEDKARWKDRRLAEIAVEECKAKKEQQKTKDYAEAIIYARANGLDENSESLVYDVEEHKEQAWREANYPDGTEMSHKCCDTCSSWTVGESRCSCGNRRMSLSVEKMSNGEFYAYAEAN